MQPCRLVHPLVDGAANRVAHFLAAAGVAPGTDLLDEQARAEVAQAPVVALARRLAGLLGRAPLPLAPLAAQKVCPDVGGRRVRGRWSLDPDRFVLGALLVASTGSACALVLAGISVVPPTWQPLLQQSSCAFDVDEASMPLNISAHVSDVALKVR